MKARVVGARLFAYFSLAALLPARDLFLVPNTFFVIPDERLTISFNIGDGFPASESAPVIDRLRDTDLINPSAVFNIVNLRPNGQAIAGEVIIKSKGILVLTARTLPLVDTIEAAHLRDYVQREGLTVTPGQGSRVRHSGYAKALIQSEASDEFFNHVVGFLIEIVPGKNPYTLHAGDELPVQVLFAGKPGANIQVTASHENESKVAGRTGADGKIGIPISGTGRWRVHASEIHKCSEPNVADWETLAASLTFEVR